MGGSRSEELGLSWRNTDSEYHRVFRRAGMVAVPRDVIAPVQNRQRCAAASACTHRGDALSTNATTPSWLALRSPPVRSPADGWHGQNRWEDAPPDGRTEPEPVVCSVPGRSCVRYEFYDSTFRSTNRLTGYRSDPQRIRCDVPVNNPYRLIASSCSLEYNQKSRRSGYVSFPGTDRLRYRSTVRTIALS